MSAKLNQHTIKYISWVLLFETVCAFNNITSRYMSLDEDNTLKGRFFGGNHHKSRFITFETQDDDINVELQLSIPFLTIPIKKSIDSVTGMLPNRNSVNVNLGAIGLAGTVVFASAFVVPSILRLLSIKHLSGGGMFQRGLGNDFIDRIGHGLEEQGLPPHECVGRLVCSLIKRSTKSEEPDLAGMLVKSVISNEWFGRMIEDTVFEEAIKFAHSEQTCSVSYSQCKMSPSSIENLMQSMASKVFSI